MFLIVASIFSEAYLVKVFCDKDQAFDYLYFYRQSFHEKGGWSLAVECMFTNEVQEDFRLTDLA